MKNTKSVPLVLLVPILFVSFCANTFAQDPTRILPGHTLFITVSGHPEFSGSFQVKNDGTIDYPMLSGIPLRGLTAVDVRKLLLPNLIRYTGEPDVFISLSESRQIEFEVKGAVQNPSKFRQEAPIDLQQALYIAGGILEKGSPTDVLVLRSTGNRRITLRFDVLGFFQQDTLILPPLIENRDIIIVKQADETKSVRVFGLVNSPGHYIPEVGDNVGDIIFRAGGINEDGKESRVTHITTRNGKTERTIYNFKKIYDYDFYKSLPEVQPGDIIIIRKQQFYLKWSWWLEMIRDISTVLTFIYLIERVN